MQLYCNNLQFYGFLPQILNLMIGWAVRNVRTWARKFSFFSGTRDRPANRPNLVMT